MSSNKPATKDSQPVQEYVIRVTPKSSKKYNVMRFNESDSIDFSKWKKVKLDRDFSLREFKAQGEDQPKFGAGSVFGAEQREESKKKRYQKYVSRQRPEDHPWILNVKLNKSATNPPPITAANSNASINNSSIKQSSTRRFKGIREGGVTDNTSYYVFFQAHDGAFEAFPVSEWYKFAPIPRFKALTAEEAEEKFIERDKIFNYFTVMGKKGKAETSDGMEDEFKTRRSRKDFKTSDMDDWNDYGGMSDGSDSDGDKKGKKKGKKKGSDDEVDSEGREESDEGDFDTREVDYMSDTSSDEDEDLAEKLNEELKGVEDEDGLRQLQLTDDEDEEEENKKNEKDKSKEEKSEGQVDEKSNTNSNKKSDSTETKVKQEKKDDSSEDSDSDFDDDDKIQSSIFMQEREIKKEIKKEAANEPQAGLKRRLETSTDSQSQPSTSSNQAKRPKVTNASAESTLEENVKRYLLRKPISAIDLIKNLRKMKITSSNELVKIISQILKKLNAQEKEINGKKFYYLDPKTFKH